MTRGRHANRAYIATHQTVTDLHEPQPEQTMQDILEAVINDPGVEEAAHEVLRQELDNATRLDRLIPIHEHLCQVDARARYRQAVATSGLDRADQAALQASPAYGPLIAELRRAESADLSVADLPRIAVNQSGLTNACDLAAVLHSRVRRLADRHLCRSGQPTLIAGLVTPAANASTFALIAPLREIESQIIQRSDWLVSTAESERPEWYEELLNAAGSGDGLARANRLAREVSAYRELYGIRSQAILGDVPPAGAVYQLRRHSRLVQALRIDALTASRRAVAQATAPGESPTDATLETNARPESV